jgi:hypothetical protein
MIWLFTLAVALTARALWGGSPWFPLMAELATLGGCWLVWKMSKGLHEVLRVLAMASVVIVGLFVIVVNIVGPTQILVSLWGGVGFTLCCYWAMRRMLLTAQEKGTQHNSSNAQKLLDALNGAKAGTPVVLEHGEVTVELEANRGEQSQEDLKPIVGALESLAGMRPGAGRLINNRKDAGRAMMSFIPKDVLEGIVPWVGPSNFGASIAEPIPVGKYADMKTASIYLTGDEDTARSLAQWLVMGMTGAGKSSAMLMAVADALTRRDVTVWAHDHVKGLQTLKPLLEAGGLDWVTMTKADGQSMLAAVRQVNGARARWLGARDYTQWTPDCGLNLLLVWIEEASDLAQLKIVLQLAREARSVGVVIILSMQRASHTTLDTDTRAQLSGNWCFGVEGSTDAKFALPDHIIDAGASPERFRNDKPGYSYIAAPGIDEERQACELRTYYPKREQIIDAVKRGNTVRRPLAEEDDQVTVEAAGKVYAKRLPSEAYLPGHPLFAKAMGMDLKAKDGREPKINEDNDDDSTADDAEDTNESYRGIGNQGSNDDGDDEDQIDMSEAKAKFAEDTNLPDCPDPNMELPHAPYEKLTPEQCRKRVQHHLKLIDEEGRNHISVPDILRMTPPIPRKREWIRAELNRLASEISGEIPDPNGYRLERDADMDAGVYRLVAPTRV